MGRCGGGKFCSGDGFTEAFAVQYGAMIRRFIVENDVGTVVDLGCGDFEVASKLVSQRINYTGIDVVEPLVEHNNLIFSSDRVRFVCMDVAEEDPPNADLCLIRQVLQHLSNAEIKRILDRCAKYPFLIVTEHYPPRDRSTLPNLDIPHGPGIRAYYDSAVVLDEPPFSLKNVSLLSETEGKDGSMLKSFLVDNR